MASKTITVTTDAYESLKSVKEPRESFSETILRVTHKRSLMEFAGALSSESAAKLETAIKGMRKANKTSHEKRIKRLSERLAGGYGSS